MTKEDVFLIELGELYKKHGLHVHGCSCCGTQVSPIDTESVDAHTKRVKENDDF